MKNMKKRNKVLIIISIILFVISVLLVIYRYSECRMGCFVHASTPTNKICNNKLAFLNLFPIVMLIIAFFMNVFVKQDEKLKKIFLWFTGTIGWYFILWLVNIIESILTPIGKPLIYIYPKKKTNVKVKLGNEKILTCTYPKYEEKWDVVAESSGNLLDKKTNKNFYGLYWEGKVKDKLKIKEGFCVRGIDTSSFLEEKLSILGLNERETNEFIMYWLPRLEKNNFNLIRFKTTEEINELMPLDINPKPDTIIRIMMECIPLIKYKEIEEQKLIKVTRKGYTVVEWGGTISNKKVFKVE